MQQEHHPIIAEAIKLCDGSQTVLARRVPCRQQTISKLLKREIPVSAEFALKISKAVEGLIPPSRFRPDLPWPVSESKTAFSDDTAARAAGSSTDPSVQIPQSRSADAVKRGGAVASGDTSSCHSHSATAPEGAKFS